MNIEQLLIQSLQLLGLGMGAVFIILTLLIFIIWAVSKLVPEEIPVVQAAPNKEPAAASLPHIAAIQAAIHKFRKSH
ncbi:MAG: OadG family transporter subunit [Gammaproteobacteria bacterium]